jgi:hypothetical protein
MSKLSLFIQNEGQTYTLKPEREYLVGSGSDSNIPISGINVASQHLKFSFNQLSHTWYVYNLDSNQGTLINNQRIGEYPIRGQTQIIIGHNIVLIATPEIYPVNSIQAQVPQANTPGNFSQPQVPSSNPLPVPPPVPVGQSPINFNVSGTSPLRKLTWEEYVSEQVQKQPNWWTRVSTRFALATGFRNTPWMLEFSGYTIKGGNSLNAFQGYIIPDFQEPEDKIRQEIQTQVSQLRQYRNTDCFVAELTDAHIADSASQAFLGVELFPIQRGNISDFRNFCVVSYHRVRTYLLVENYGTDLFVSWITRFEPEPSPVFLILWLAVSILLTLILLSNTQGNLLIGSVPLSLWSIIYLLIPTIMLKLKILPKKANARLIIGVTLFLYFIFVMGLLTTLAINQINQFSPY